MSRCRQLERALGAGIVVVVLFSFGTARADVRTEARRHFRLGMELIERGEIDAGVAELERAYETLPHPNVLYNIARAYTEAGRFAEAIEHFERYLATDPPDRSEVAAFVRAIESRRAEARGEEAAPEQPREAPAVADASPEQVIALRESATQIEALAESTNSDELRARARLLYEMAASLEARGTRADAGGAPEDRAGAASQERAEPASRDAPAKDTELHAGDLADAQENLYEETVVSASRFAQNPLDAPNSVYNITRQDIRLAGLPNVAELIRRSPGTHVMATGPADLQIGIRGFNQRLSPRVLLLVNGRSAYLDPLGANFYWVMPFGMDEIERIEVIRGPASALYGADAFSGIINVITRRPGDEPGTYAFAGYGNLDQVRSQVTHSGRRGRIGYRIGAGYDQIDRYTTRFPADSVNRASPFDEEGDLDFRILRAMGSLQYRPTPRLTLDLEGGASDADGTVSAGASLDDMYTSGPTTHVMGSLQSEWGYLRAFWNYVDAVGDVNTGRLRNRFAWHTIDVEGAFARAIHLGWDHNVTVGLAYRKKLIDWDFLGARSGDENHYAGFFQDTMRFGEKLLLVASLRLDQHPLLADLQVSPRGALVIRPTDATAVRLSSGRAFRTQTFLESYLDLRLPTPIAAVSGQGYGAERNEALFGAANLRPEQIVSNELGFRYVAEDSYDVDVAAYYNRVTDLVRLNSITPFTLGQVGGGLGGYDPSTGTFAAGTITYANEQNEFDVVGGEAMVRVYPITGLDVYANYAYNHAFVSGPDHRPSASVGPRHLFNVGVQFRSSIGVDFSTDLHFVGKQIWQEQVADSVLGIADHDLPLPGYYFIDARLGTRLVDDAIDLGVVAQNLTNNEHYEHPFGQRIPLRIMGTVAFRF